MKPLATADSPPPTPPSSMPIRFHCSNGHLLQVGEELAGKRGACPECGEKVTVPAPGGQQGSPAAEAKQSEEASATQEPATQEPTPQAPASQTAPKAVARPVAKAKPAAPAPPAPPPAAEVDPHAQWYLRTAAGEQFGPAATALFQQWIREHRVTADSYVWRDGWPDWRPAGAAAAELPAPLASAPPPPPPAPPAGDSSGSASDVAIPPLDGPAAEGPSAASRYAVKKKRAAKRRKYLAIFLAVMTLVLGGVLIAVLMAPSEEPDPLEGATPLATPADEPLAAADEPEEPLPEDDESATMEEMDREASAEQ